jgi:hypothetical protein
MKVPPATLPDNDRRKFPPSYVSSQLIFAIKNESLKESLGLGGLGVRNLTASIVMSKLVIGSACY